MAEAYVGEIRLFSMSYAPEGWHLCDGTLLPIAQNQALFSLIFNQYGGDGKTTFALPDLRGRVPINVGQPSRPESPTTYQIASSGGLETVPSTFAQLAAHSHQLVADKTNGVTIGGGSVYFAEPIISAAAPTAQSRYANAGSLVALNPAVISSTGGGVAHDNMQPYLVLNYCICTAGYYPTRP